MSKQRTSIRDNSPLTGLISEPVAEEEVKQSDSHKVKQSQSRDLDEETQQETLYLFSSQVIELEDLVLQLKRRKPRIKTSKSALARAAVDLLLAKEPEEIAALLS